MNNISQPAFAPGASTVNITAAGTTGRVQVQAAHNNRHVRVWNSGSVTVFVEFGDSAVVAATATSMPIPAGNTEIFSCAHAYVAAITASSTASLYITPGEGL